MIVYCIDVQTGRLGAARHWPIEAWHDGARHDEAQ